jgi:AraC-like DNA-binding protein
MGALREDIDPLSDVLSLLRPRSSVSAFLDAGGDWSIQFPREGGIRFHAVISGHCWLAAEGVPDPVRLNPGDCFLLPSGRPFRLASDLTLPPDDAYAVLSAKRDGVATCNGGGDFLGVGCLFTLAGRNADFLLGELPPIVQVREKSEQLALRWSLERMFEEQRARRPGGFLVAQHLAHMMLIQALRMYLAEGSEDGVSWLFALADTQMSAAIAAMHEDPAHRWTLQALGERAGMSRTSFTVKFKQTVGASPMEYLTRWRMLVAGDRLTHSADPVSAIALSLGYESESAFGTAFKRVMGCSPRRYSRGGAPVVPTSNEPEGAGASQPEAVANLGIFANARARNSRHASVRRHLVRG